jgi:enoyl-CoA hydratase/carnithine racemase
MNKLFSTRLFKKHLKNLYSTVTEFTTIKYEKRNNIAIVTLNRPKALNSLNKQLCEEVGKIMSEIEKNDEIKGFLYFNLKK